MGTYGFPAKGIKTFKKSKRTAWDTRPEREKATRKDGNAGIVIWVRGKFRQREKIVVSEKGAQARECGKGPCLPCISPMGSFQRHGGIGIIFFPMEGSAAVQGEISGKVNACDTPVAEVSHRNRNVEYS